MKELTSVQLEFLKILESFMRDKTYVLPGEFEGIGDLFQMAQVHQMTAAVYEQIRRDTIWQKEEYRNLFMIWKRVTMRDVMMQVQRAEGFLTVYEKLSEAGIKPLVVKGLICRNMYAKPDYRISGDEDMLIRKEDFVRCDEILRHEGFERAQLEIDETVLKSEEVPSLQKEEAQGGQESYAQQNVESRDEQESYAQQNAESRDEQESYAQRKLTLDALEKLPYEIPYLNKQNGTYIELHFTLFPEESGAYGHLNEEFRQVFEHSICEEIQGKKVWTLCPTEHLFYLICHSFKHFLHSGFGLRQVCDMVLMAEQYGARIDWKDVEERLDRLNMKLYWDALVKIGEEYFGFSHESAAYPASMRNSEVDCSPMLEDLLESGIYGDSSMERKHSSNMTLAAAAGGKASTTASLLASLFPGADYMKEKFPWAKKYPALLPAAYVVRIVRYLKKSGRKSKGEESSVQIGMERVELMRKYRIIE